MSSDRRIDCAAASHHAEAHRFVFTLDLARFDGSHQRGMRLERARHDHQAARVLVEPMHDTGAGHLRESGIEVQQRVLQRPRGIPGAGMHDQPGGLVDHEHLGVLHARCPARSPPAPRSTASGSDALDFDGFPADDLVLRPQLHAIHQHLAGLDPLLDPRARILRQQFSKRLIEPLPGGLEGDRQAMSYGVRH